MTLFAFLQVVLRQFFSTGILWADVLLRHLVLWSGLLGAALASADNKNFAWEAVFLQKGRFGLARRLLAEITAVFVTALLVKVSWSFWTADKATGEILFTIGTIATPSWIFSLILPVGFLLVLIHYFMRLLKTVLS
jgi:TRAP-type C4-dicarboxylate transport system permease small subunit